MKLKQKVDRKTKAWKITSIRIPFETAQKVETLAIKAKVRSATEAIIQLLEDATKGTKALPAKKLDWARKPDASARKDYTKKPAKKAKAARRAKSAKKVAPRKTKPVKAKASRTPAQKAARAARDKARAAAPKTETPAAASTNGTGTEAQQ